MTRSELRPAVGAGLLAFLLYACPAAGRYLASSPVSPRQAIGAVQKRAARHTVLLEVLPAPCVFSCSYASRVVIHDPQGMEPPRDVTPGGPDGVVFSAAAWESGDGRLRLLAYTGSTFLYSGDGGSTWAPVPLPAQAKLSPGPASRDATDFGGPIVGGISSPIRLGTVDVPFVLAVDDPAQPGIWGIRADGSAFQLVPASGPALLGSDVGGTTFLVGAYGFAASRPPGPPALWNVATLDLLGKLTPLLQIPINYGPPSADTPPWMAGWITPGGDVYFNALWASPPIAPFSSPSSVSVLRNGSVTELATAAGTRPPSLFAVPTADFSGAWIVNRGTAATTLQLHTAAGGLVPQWSDPGRPPVEAIYTGDSGRRLLLQTSRIRPQNDTAVGLAIWNVGEPAPSPYDQLVLWSPRGFTHLDVDAAAEGQAFVFAAKVAFITPFQIGWLPGAGEEFGVVRASLRQRLLVPASARAPGQFGAFWKTDLVLHNPDSSPLSFIARFLPSPPSSGPTTDATLTLAANSIAVIPDALGSIFHLEKGSGAVMLVPEGSRSLATASRSYTAVPDGTYGMGVGAVDLSAGAGPGFPMIFPAGLLGSDFRTNVVATDASGQGSQLDLVLSTLAGKTGGGLAISVHPNGQSQVTGLAGWLGTPTAEAGSLSLTPDSGRAAGGVIAIDDLTNDPTWFGPAGDRVASWSVLPSVVHADGARGAQFRTDLFLFNPDAVSTLVRLAVKAWDQDEEESLVDLTLEPGESRSLRDVLATTFGRTGVARLRFQSAWMGPVLGARITSRTYTVRPDGSTYGMQLPALDTLQTAAGGETLDILGPTRGPASRTNLALVGVGDGYLQQYESGWGRPVTARVAILDDHGALLDSFDVSVPFRGGVQINDLFRARGLGDGPGAALIRIRPSDGYLAGYATTIDNGTNDPVYFAANLAAP